MSKKYFKIVPSSETAAVISAANEEDAIIGFATNMDSDMNTYFEAIEITKKEFEELKDDVDDLTSE